MRYAMLAGLVGVLAFGLAVSASGQNVPWKADGDIKAPAVAPAAGAPAAPAAAAEGVTPAAGPDTAKLEKAAGPVKDVLAQIAKVQKLLDDELAKPDAKRDAKKIPNFKEGIARLYLTAAQKAKVQSQSAIFTKAEDKQAFLEQYEKPNREKAIALLFELANEALGKKDYRSAEALGRQILILDPKNAEAGAFLKSIAEEKAAALKAGAKNTGAGSGDSLKDKNLDPNLRDFKRDGRGTKTDWGKTGRTW
ncbi:MAG: hypothetical protein IMZ44_06465 [Planctomycetes bacterium]|nr:hypothetical protein [Planctomycetota bacterium]